MRKALVIYNPAAGRFPVKPFLKAIDTELVKAGWRADIVATRSGEHTIQLGQQAAAEEYDAAFAVGGDGTIGQVASGLIGSETALGVLPAGIGCCIEEVQDDELAPQVFKPQRRTVQPA